MHQYFRMRIHHARQSRKEVFHFHRNFRDSLLFLQIVHPEIIGFPLERIVIKTPCGNIRARKEKSRTGFLPTHKRFDGHRIKNADIPRQFPVVQHLRKKRIFSQILHQNLTGFFIDCPNFRSRQLERRKRPAQRNETFKILVGGSIRLENGGLAVFTNTKILSPRAGRTGERPSCGRRESPIAKGLENFSTYLRHFNSHDKPSYLFFP